MGAFTQPDSSSTMQHPHFTALLLAAGLLVGSAPLLLAADAEQGPPAAERGGQDDVVAAPTTGGIAWFGRWDDAKAEAERTGRPILLMSAAPQCSGAPGMW